MEAADTFTEISESDAVTTYRLTQRLWSGVTAVGTDVLIADSAEYGRMLFLDGELQSASADEHIYHEALVHPVMSAATKVINSPLRVLVVGGGEGATVREVVRWGNITVDWVDYDGDLVAACATHLKWAPHALGNPYVKFYPEDIRTMWPRFTVASYDVIILDLPDPDGDTGYLYSADFWSDVKRYVKPHGRIVTHCGPVKPYGSVGCGFQRARNGLGLTDANGFYRVGIPSFQGDWGFLLWSADGTHGITSVRPVWGPRVADEAQLGEWSRLSKVWLDAIQTCNGIRR